jgi:hypothetical protein
MVGPQLYQRFQAFPSFQKLTSLSQLEALVPSLRQLAHLLLLYCQPARHQEERSKRASTTYQLITSIRYRCGSLCIMHMNTPLHAHACIIGLPSSDILRSQKTLP